MASRREQREAKEAARERREAQEHATPLLIPDQPTEPRVEHEPGRGAQLGLDETPPQLELETAREEEAITFPDITLSEGESRVALARHQLNTMARDEFGLPISSLSLTDAQYRWLSHRLDAESDEAADEASETDRTIRMLWQGNPDFVAVQQTATENKREGFRILSAQLLPRTLRTLYDMLNSRNVQAQKAAATLILRSQALLLDRPPQTDQNALSDLVSMLRERSEVTPIEIEPR